MKGRYKIVIVLWLLGALIYTLMFLPAEHRIKNIYQDKQDIDIHSYYEMVSIDKIGVVEANFAPRVSTEKYIRVNWQKYWIFVVLSMVVTGIVLIVINIFSCRKVITYDEKATQGRGDY
jgi:hypothetical protein